MCLGESGRHITYYLKGSEANNAITVWVTRACFTISAYAFESKVYIIGSICVIYPNRPLKIAFHLHLLPRAQSFFKVSTYHNLLLPSCFSYLRKSCNRAPTFRHFSMQVRMRTASLLEASCTMATRDFWCFLKVGRHSKSIDITSSCNAGEDSASNRCHLGYGPPLDNTFAKCLKPAEMLSVPSSTCQHTGGKKSPSLLECRRSIFSF